MSPRIRLAVVIASVAGATASFAAVRPAGPSSPAGPVPILTPEPRASAAATPAPARRRRNPDPLHPSGRLIEISIRHQTLTAWQDGKAVYRFVISTGRPGYETPTGRYRILEKYRNRWSRTWSVWMPYAMRWYRGYFIHRLPHRDGSSSLIGASRLGRPDSHGCVRVGVGDAERLYRWAGVGTPVWIH